MPPIFILPDRRTFIHPRHPLDDDLPMLPQTSPAGMMKIAQSGGATLLPLTPFDKGKLKIAAHVREELDRAGLSAQSIQCKSGGTQTHPDTARLTVTIDGISQHVDFKAYEVEDCEAIVAGEMWHKIAALIDRLK
jgi:hypothetical protein